MFNTGNGDGSFFIDDIVFNNQEIEMLKNGNFSDCDSNWVVDQTKEAKGQIEYVKDGPDGKTALRLTVISISDAPWRLQIYQKGMRIEKGKNYQMSFWVKSDRIGDFTVNCMQNHEPWAHPTQQKMSVSTEWKQIQFIFVGAWNDDNSRITFTNLGTIPGQVYWFAYCSLKQTTVNARQN